MEKIIITEDDNDLNLKEADDKNTPEDKKYIYLLEYR